MSAEEIIETSYRNLPAIVDSSQFMPIMDITQALKRRQAIVDFTSQCMKDGHDYGTIPGTNKPTLYKPGAEKLCSMFGLTPKFNLDQCEEDWTGERHGGEPFFYYRYSCSLYRGDFLLADSEGSCNSWEKKYRYRRVFGNKATEEEKRRGKPVVGRYGSDYLLPNDDMADLVNTFQKMAQKRAMIAAVLLATNASEFYTQDLEDLSMSEPASEATTPPQETQTAEPVKTAAEWKTDCKNKAFDLGYTGNTGNLLVSILGRTPKNFTPEIYAEAFNADDERWIRAIAALAPIPPADVEAFNAAYDQNHTTKGEKPLSERIIPASLSPEQDKAFTEWCANCAIDRVKFSEVVGRELPCNEIGFATLADEELVFVNYFIQTGDIMREGKLEVVAGGVK